MAISRYRGAQWGVLLVFLMLAFLAEPILGDTVDTEAMSLVLFGGSVIGAAFLFSERPLVRLVGGAFSLLWLVCSVATYMGAPLQGAVAGLSGALVGGALLATFHHLITTRESNLQALLAAVFGYLLLAMAYAILFVHMERFQPGSFLLPDDSGLWSSMVYYSLVTLTTMGYGDILPLSPRARIAAGFEAVAGVLYIAVMVGSIVGGFHSNRRR